MPFARRVDRRWDNTVTGRRSGGRSRRDVRAKTPPLMPEYRLSWEPGGSGRPAACHHRNSPRRRSRRRGDTCPSPSERKSRCCAFRATACARSRDVSGGRPPRCRANCGATRLRAAAASSSGPQPRSGTPTARRGVQSLRSWPRTTSCASMCRSDSPAGSPRRKVRRSSARALPGRAVGPGRDKLGGGYVPGARSRSRADCGSTSRRTRRCASATRPSTSRSTSRVAER
jgi:hypothetical protein